ncbi:hypothetical protein [Pontiella sulfatireligans]|nr:hypothetical protein [Pontiella sulfatireligans]
MQEVGFIEIKDDHIVIHDWDAVNASLIASWNNGGKGGRRPKKNPEKTHGLSVGVPNKTQTEPIREEKMRLEKIGECGASDEAPPPAPNSKFIAPTKKQVAEHIWNTAKAKKLEIAEDKTESMAEQIFCHYENADWRLSGGKGGKMKDWKLAVTKWIMGDVEDGKIKRARA